MVPKPLKEFLSFVDDISDNKINWQNYSHGESHPNVFNNDVFKDPFRMDLQKIVKGDPRYDPDDPYLDLAVQSNRVGGKKTSTALGKQMKHGRLGPVYATLKIHKDARPDAQTFKALLRIAGKDCHLEDKKKNPVSYCVQIEPDGSWRCHQTGESGQGTIFVPPNQQKVEPAAEPAAPAQDEQKDDEKNAKGKKKGKKGGK